MFESKKSKVRHWLIKDSSLSNIQIKELTGASDHTIWEIRRELDLRSEGFTPTQKQIDLAFKKFMKAQGREIKRHPLVWRKSSN